MFYVSVWFLTLCKFFNCRDFLYSDVMKNSSSLILLLSREKGLWPTAESIKVRIFQAVWVAYWTFLILINLKMGGSFSQIKDILMVNCHVAYWVFIDMEIFLLHSAIWVDLILFMDSSAGLEAPRNSLDVSLETSYTGGIKNEDIPVRISKSILFCLIHRVNKSKMRKQRNSDQHLHIQLAMTMHANAKI